ncbi:MAG TPA: glucose 1-dehydrogenase [Anaerolineales bacterium]|nr:glucose 1-dehydrogenase [Anaerolineales bacterium]
MGRLDNKCAIITGGASGIGKATALLLAQEGAAVVIADINEEQGKQVENDIKQAGGRAVAVKCNVAKADDCQHAVKTALDTFGRLDILFNNAGIIRRTDVTGITEEDWDLVMAINVKSIYLMCKYAIPHMTERGGSIVNTGSGWGIKGGRNAISYCASKGAVVNMTRALAIDHGPQNIRVNCICPGDTDTPMLRNEAQQLGQAEDTFMAEAAERPLKRYAQPIEIAQSVLYLVSDESSYVTGAVLAVDGGGTA